MQVMTRRMVLAGTGALAAASVAAALLLRKPAPPVVMLPESEPQPKLLGMDALQRLSPPRPTPAIGFGDAAGATHRLADFLGKGVVLNVWATWCAPCVAEMPALAALAAKAGAYGIVVVPLSVDRGGADTVRRFYAAHGIKGLGIWTDSSGEAGRALGVADVPTTFVIDRKGRETALLQGPAEWSGDAALAALRALVG